MSVDWIAVDWGTSNLRIWAMDAGNCVVGEIRSDEGMGALEKGDFERVLMSHIAPWLGDQMMPVLACGMVGARQGWAEAPYADVPTRPATRAIKVQANDPRLNVNIISGLKQIEPADVMRGEETQIAGFLAKSPEYTGAICLPGTHSKWVHIENGEIVRFQTAMTGELFALLSSQSVLRHSLSDWDDSVFLDAMDVTFANPERVSMQLFEIRAKALLEGDKWGASRLSAALIGAELSAARRFWHSQKVTIIGAGELARLYGLALDGQGVNVNVMKAMDLTLAGLIIAKQEILNA